jgi:hypothetical protein
MTVDSTRYPFACVACRRCFRRTASRTLQRRCPSCTGQAIQMGRKFKAPRRDDDEQWRKVELLIDHGIFFDRGTDPAMSGRSYPRTLAEARTLVRGERKPRR